MKFLIEKNIPPPPGKSVLKQEIEDTLTDLLVGDSFFVLFSKIRSEKSIRWTFENAKKKFAGRKFTGAKDKNSADSPGMRIWRLPDPKPDQKKP